MARRVQVRILLSIFLITSLITGLDALDTPATGAATFTVDSTADEPDADPGNGVCASAGGQCTLRAAIEETNALAGMDSVTVPVGTYPLDDQLVIDDSLFLNGAGRNQVFIDGQGSTGILRVRTVELLVCDSGNNSVASYDRNGQRNPDFLSSGAGGMDRPGAISIRNGGDVMVTAFSSGVHHFDSDGRNLGLFVDPADFAPTLIGPTDGVFGTFPDAPNRDFYIADFFPGGRILKFDAFDSSMRSTFVAAGSGGLQQPDTLVFHNDDLYVTDAGSDQVLRYNGDTGAFIDVFVPKFPSGLDRPRGLVFHDDYLFVANELTDSVLRYDANTGAFIDTFVPSGSGGLDKPSELVFGPDNNLYIISRGNKSILRYDGDTGAFIDTFVTGGDIFLRFPSCLEWRTGAGDGPIVNLSGITLQNGSSRGTGGLIVDDGAHVSLRDGAVRNVESGIFGGGIRNGGSLDLIDVEVTGNTLSEGGGGMTSAGGGIFNTGNLSITRSLVANNFATRGGGISSSNTGARVNITNSTISGNRSFGAGGGIRNVARSIINISSSTISDNRANEPGGFGESNRFGGGIFNSPSARVNMANTILAGNTDNRSNGSPDYSPDCYSTEIFHFTSQRDNFVGVLTSNCIFRDTTWGDNRFDEVGTPDDPLDPEISILTGGVHRPLPGSPVIDADTAVTSATFFDCQPDDQLGNPRPVDGDVDGAANCDIGAVEYQPRDDGDGISGAVEDGAPNDGDGNDDGIPDRLQPAVASFPNAKDGRYISIVAEDGVRLFSVEVDDVAPPTGVVLPYGQVKFSLGNLPADGRATVQLLLPDSPVTAFYKFGPTPTNSIPSWYEFDFAGGVGALVNGATITLHLADGARGDADLSVNGTIEDPGAPGIAASPSTEITVDLGGERLGGKEGSVNVSPTRAVTLPDGSYDVVLTSADPDHGPDQSTQPVEQWFIEGLDEDGEVVFRTDPTDDLPDRSILIVTSVGRHEVAGVVAVRARHFSVSDAFNSIVPISVTFTPATG